MDGSRSLGLQRGALAESKCGLMRERAAAELTAAQAAAKRIRTSTDRARTANPKYTPGRGRDD